MDAPQIPSESLRMNNTNTLQPVTVSQILDRYEHEVLPDLAPRTQKDYRRHLARLHAIFGVRIAGELQPRDFAEFLNVRKGRTHRVRCLAVFSAALNVAVKRWYWIERNVLRDVERPKNKPRDRLILDAEFAGCKALAPKRVQLAMLLAVLTGQRQGDIIRFRWSDIRGMDLHVYQAKTRKRLAIEITPDLEAVLDQCWLLKGGGHAGSEWVLPTRGGVAYTSEGFRAGWQRTIKKWMRCGGENFHFHDLRALAATRCETPERAMRLLGHTTLAMTMRVYRRGVERVKALQLGA